MYYEEKWIDGVLHNRGTPSGDWTVVRDPLVIAKAALMNLAEWQRVEIMDQFCNGCGTDFLPCHCYRLERIVRRQ